MAKNITIKRGLDINILGDASTNMDPKHIPVKTFAVIPDDYIGFSPKVYYRQKECRHMPCVTFIRVYKRCGKR